MKNKLKNGDLVVFTESPFIIDISNCEVNRTTVSVENLEGNYFQFKLPGMPSYFTASVRWVKKVEADDK